MKKILTLIVCLVITGGLFAQDKAFSWGVKAGLNLSTYTGKDVSGAKMKAGFNAGVVTEIRCAEKFSVGPELVYSLQGAKNSEATMNASYINLPIMAKYYVIKNLSINLGPQIGYAVSINGKEKGGSSEKLDKDLYNAFDFSVGVGATYNFGKFFAEARYNQGFTKVIKDVKNYNSTIQVGVGYKF